LELNSPNDVVVTREGCILFTDPTFGRNERFGMERPIPRPERSVYCLAPSGDLRVVRDDFQEPNGLCLSPDGSVLYVNDSPRAEIRAFGWSRDHCTDEGAIFANRIGNGVFGEGIVDGMKADRAGNIWVTGPGGVWVFDPSGTHLGIVSVPEEVGNLHWGGDDFSDLYICATSSLYRLQTATSGAMEPFLHGLARGIAQQ
jgi:gluconolactonase